MFSILSLEVCGAATGSSEPGQGVSDEELEEVEEDEVDDESEELLEEPLELLSFARLFGLVTGDGCAFSAIAPSLFESSPESGLSSFWVVVTTTSVDASPSKGLADS